MYADILATYKDNANPGIYAEMAPVWVCWWTGLASAPQLVKQCIKSIKRHSNNHPVFIITKDNFNDYLDIPPYIIEKVNSGKICIANFSDYLRISLLEKYGGLWLDATLFVPRELPENLFSVPLFTCKSAGAAGFFANGRWTSYCLGGWKHNTFFEVVKKCFERFWEKNDYAIDYLLVDYTFACVYENISYCRKSIDDIPISNLERNALSNAMVRGAEAEYFDTFISNSTALYKLSWREYYPTKTKSGKDTVYAHFLKM